jgi:type I restriction enzyme M protein
MTSEQLKQLEDRLWEAADKLRVDSGLKASEYATPILGLIFLRFASIRYNKVKPEIEALIKAQQNKRLQRQPHEIAIEKCGFYLPPQAEYEYLLNLPEQKNIAKAIKQAMEEIESYKPELQGSLPKDEYFKLIAKDDKSLPKTLLKIFADIPEDATGDVFGKVYEYFLAEFALAEGQGGGEFFTPTSVVKLMVEIIEPYKGTIFDPACGSGGMFVQSSQFVDRRREELHETDTKDLMVYGCERTPETVKLAKMNLAVNGLRGEIQAANSYYEDPYESYHKFDYVMANPPFNVDDVNLDRVKSQQRFNEYGIPQNKSKKTGKKKDNPNTVPNANYLWISLFATSLKPKGRAALVMANSASDARHSEADIRQKLIRSGVIDCMLTLPKNMFYTVTLPATLWFFDKNKAGKEPKVLFIDARNIFRQVTRALREFTEEHIQNIATIVRLYRGETRRLKELLAKYKKQAADFEKQAAAQQKAVEQLKKEKPDNDKEVKRWEKQLEEAEKKYKVLHEKQHNYEGHIQWLNERFPNGVYEDVTGLCKAATLKEIEEQDWSLNPGRYVGVVIEEDGLTEEEFLSEMKERHQLLNNLNAKAVSLVQKIEINYKELSC